MELCIKNDDFLDSFDQLLSIENCKCNDTQLHLFMLKINSNKFDKDYFVKKIKNPVIDYALSRTVKEKYKDRPADLVDEARTKFRNYLSNKGELGEFLLFCFLESHLKAPKILSKLELKTSTENYVNGSDGVHFRQLPNGDYQIIFGESKMIINLTKALTDAFESIYEFKNEINKQGKEKSGINYEKSLISDHLEKETFTEEEAEFLDSIIYPKRTNKFDVDHSFGIFIGYEVTINEDDKKLPNKDFRNKIKEQIKTEILSRKAHIIKKITEFDLIGHQFYIYIIPFTNLDETREEITKRISK
jgi:hypothetical protein